jgi:geranylgeranyl pyrophosphate synthase
LINNYYQEALKSLNHLNTPKESKTELFAFAEYLMERQM